MEKNIKWLWIVIIFILFSLVSGGTAAILVSGIMYEIIYAIHKITSVLFVIFFIIFIRLKGKK
jgi:hypothetical protein